MGKDTKKVGPIEALEVSGLTSNSVSDIENRILTVRGVQVMMDSDLAELYGVETKFLNRAVKRNANRFPETFMFQLTWEEYESSRFHFGTMNVKRGHNVKYLPHVFTEQGVAMLSALLRSETAVLVSIRIMEAFVAMRRFLVSNEQIFRRVRSILKTHNAQYAPIEVKLSKNVHDRFTIVDDDVYHIGASIKDLGKKIFAFSRMNEQADELLGRIV